jgi:hypothetical protein
MAAGEALAADGPVSDDAQFIPNRLRHFVGISKEFSF